jgi:hypothetical protein
LNNQGLGRGWIFIIHDDIEYPESWARLDIEYPEAGGGWILNIQRLE